MVVLLASPTFKIQPQNWNRQNEELNKTKNILQETAKNKIKTTKYIYAILMKKILGVGGWYCYCSKWGE